MPEPPSGYVYTQRSITARMETRAAFISTQFNEFISQSGGAVPRPDFSNPHNSFKNVGRYFYCRLQDRTTVIALVSNDEGYSVHYPHARVLEELWGEETTIEDLMRGFRSSADISEDTEWTM